MTLLPPYMTMYIPTLGVFFTGKGQSVLGEDGVQLLGNEGSHSESTFRKYYHGLKTLQKKLSEGDRIQGMNLYDRLLPHLTSNPFIRLINLDTLETHAQNLPSVYPTCSHAPF